MSELGRLWVGHLFGTNTGKLSLELEGTVSADGTERTGTLRLSDDQLGVLLYSVTVKFDGTTLVIEGKPQEDIEGVAQGAISAHGSLQPGGHLSGEWSSEVGTGGAFELFSHKGAAVRPEQQRPEQIYTANRDLGALRLYRNDIAELISTLQRKFPGSRIVVTHIDRGAELALFADEFESKVRTLDRLNWVKLNVQGAAEGGFVKSLTIDLRQTQ